jgi:hypothetical protein
MNIQSTVELWADYGCYPTWQQDENDAVPRNIDPVSLPISSKLASDILNWGNMFDATLNDIDPFSSGFETQKEHEAFVACGRELAIQLRRQLSNAFEVVYVNDITLIREIVSIA